MNAGNSGTSNAGRKSKLYFGVAACMFVLLALLWSIDASFVYLFLGIGSFFVFLGIWTMPKTKHESGRYSYDQRTQSSPTFFSDLFKTKPKYGTEQTTSFNSGTNKAIIGFVTFFAVSFFFVVIVSVFFYTEGDSVPEDASFYQQAENFRYNAQYDSADCYYKKALEEDPENLEVLNGYGLSLLDRNNFDVAQGVFEQALIVDPDYEYARFNKALVLYYKKRYKESLKETFDLMDRNPAYYSAMVLAGDNYYAQQRYDSAQYWYANGYENGERSAWLCHVLGYLYDQKGDQEKAVHLYQEALSYDSTRIDIYVRLGELFPGQEGESYRMTASKLKSEGY